MTLHCINTYIHTYIHTCVRTYIHTYKHSCMHAYIHYITLHFHSISFHSITLHLYIYTYIHAYIHTYVHACMHTYIHTYVHTYIYIHTIQLAASSILGNLHIILHDFSISGDNVPRPPAQEIQRLQSWSITPTDPQPQLQLMGMKVGISPPIRLSVLFPCWFLEVFNQLGI